MAQLEAFQHRTREFLVVRAAVEGVSGDGAGGEPAAHGLSAGHDRPRARATTDTREAFRLQFIAAVTPPLVDPEALAA
ncbi:hypothetical protein D3272_12700 [Lichenibacterium ramalinae]|uniref:Uncharacterized protein n=1 Tax=Lichenibacterium ramalinae TaxID=2316527 RepID=A0A4Q2RCG1_9HYPH|nr:hypothetical protein D3272_12700 [Lichenibacterium ramalinae]